MMLPEGALVSLAIVVPWYYLLYREHGWEYIRAFIFGENLGRYAEAVGEQSRGVLFYFPVMLADLFPWSLLIPVAIWWAVRERSQDRVARLLAIWIATIVLFFSLSATKEDLYILPMVAAEAALDRRDTCSGHRRHNGTTTGGVVFGRNSSASCCRRWRDVLGFCD